ncbi:glycosyltransferase family 32 protein [Colletotrichum tofieldiae]|nr:glycosyltransferase family 32 protein [Colletotrichum tofieldiae]
MRSRRRRAIIRIVIVALMIPVFLQWALAYLLGSGSWVLPHELQHADSILVVTAHPDDECLFFAPTILGILDRNRKIRGGLLAMSIGNNYGIGEMRKRELRGSCAALGIELSRCEALDHPDLQDNPTAWWDAAIIQSILEDYVHKWNVSVIITFDEGGVSGHINHRAVSAAVRYVTFSQ